MKNTPNLSKRARKIPLEMDLPWQLEMFRRTLKKRQKLEALLSMAGVLQDERCLLVTCGDNNGALNWHFRNHGGHWTWVDAEEGSRQSIETLLDNQVFPLDKANPALPFPANQFDLVVTIDVHEHLKSVKAFNQEIHRVVVEGGRAIVTVPNGDESKPLVRLKEFLGMSPDVYGHHVVGYDIPDLQRQLEEVGLKPNQFSSYSRFFTELLELIINFMYVKVLSRDSSDHEPGQIVPQSQSQIQSVGLAYRFYGWIYPTFRLISKLDKLLPFERGYAVVVAAEKA